MVKTSIPNRERREVIRKTWGGVKAYDGMRQEVVFLVGTTEDAAENAYLLEESDRFGDILQFDIIDNAM